MFSVFKLLVKDLKSLLFGKIPFERDVLLGVESFHFAHLFNLSSG